MRKTFLKDIEGLVCTLEDSDRYTAVHSRGITGLSVGIGRLLGLKTDQLDDLFWGALLHDVGKIAVDPSILNKPGELTAGEYRHIMTHAVVGASLVRPLVNDSVADIISHHHDRYDGARLDQVACGEDIPLGARIVAVADAFDAMTSDRPYRTAMPEEEAVAEIERCSGTHFDPRVTGVFFELTPREQEVVVLLDSGRTNRAIAEALYTDVKTVSHHINSIYTKMKSERIAETMHFDPRVAGVFFELTPREQEVAVLLDSGYTNRAVAEALYIDVKTVRHHINSIYTTMKSEHIAETMPPRVDLAHLYLDCFRLE